MSFRFPEHPNTNRTDPFRDDQGRNPFAEGPSADEQQPVAANPYTSGQASRNSYVPTGYEQTERSRGKLLIVIATVGCGFSALAAASIGVGLLVPGISSGGLLLFAAGPLLLGTAASCSAWLLARHELRAVRAGAMPPDDYRRTRRALICGVAGTLIALLPVVILIVWLAAAVLEALAD
jgi:hypothetical protein